MCSIVVGHCKQYCCATHTSSYYLIKEVGGYIDIIFVSLMPSYLCSAVLGLEKNEKEAEEDVRYGGSFLIAEN